MTTGMTISLPEKDQRIQDAIKQVLIDESASNLDALNAAMILMTRCLQLYPLGMREAHTDAAINAVIEATFAECLQEDGPEVKQ